MENLGKIKKIDEKKIFLAENLRIFIRNFIRFWQDSGKILTRIWKDSDKILARLWQEFGRILTRFWRDSDKNLGGFWQESVKMSDQKCESQFLNQTILVRFVSESDKKCLTNVWRISRVIDIRSCRDPYQILTRIWQESVSDVNLT